MSVHEYVKEVLKCAEYRKGADLECVVAISSVLPGCMTQGANVEEARDNVIDAIELWVTVGLREGAGHAGSQVVKMILFEDH